MDTLDPAIADAVRASFARQTVMPLLGARLVRVEAGAVSIEIGYREDLCQQHGLLHAGIVTTVLDSACGYAALTAMPAGSDVLSVEFKVNLLRPASGQRFRADATVIRPGRTVTVVRADCFASGDGGERLVATMLATMIRREPEPRS